MPRILTLTLNPAIDLWSETETVRPMHKTRTSNDQYDPGGGGINVARVLTSLGADVEAVALAGGVTGQLLDELLTEAGVTHRFVPCAGRTRINHVVFERRSGQEYKFVLPGPPVSPDEIHAVLDAVEMTPARYLVVSGSLPPNVPAAVMAEIGDRARARGVRFVVDTSGPALAAAVAGGSIHLLKASQSELESLVDRDLPDPAEQELVARDLVLDGRAEMVAVTLGGEGAFVVTREGTWRRAAPPVRVLSTVGAGDSFLAAMVWSLDRGETPAEALAWAVAAGAAAVSRAGTKLSAREDVERIHAAMVVPASSGATG